MVPPRTPRTRNAAELGFAALQRRDFAEASRLFREAIADNETSASVVGHLGIALVEQGEHENAEPFLRQALERDPNQPLKQRYLAKALSKQGRLEEAVTIYREAIKYRPNDCVTHAELGVVLAKLLRVEEGIAALRLALELDPAYQTAHAALIYALDFSAQATLAEQQDERRRWYERHARRFGTSIRPFSNIRDPERQLRIGYVSADFRVHSAAMAFGPIIRHHDPTAFEVYCYYGADAVDIMTLSLQKAASKWRSTVGMTDETLAAQVREDRIDILVDLSGYTVGSRLFAFAQKPAPIQVTAWGFATGTGFGTIDCLFSDPVSIPREVRHLFAEEIVDLPCCVCYEPPGDAPDVSRLPSLLGKPFTFGSINRIEKWSDGAITLAARILRAMPQSRLLLKAAALQNPAVARATLRQFAERGIDADRLILRGRTDVYDHLNTLQEVDLALDPFPVNGGITTAETLWMGVPVLALLGNSTPGRISASILTAVGMRDWIAQSEDEYVRIALEFAGNPSHLATLRRHMRQHMANTPVFNIRRYTSHVEAAYRDFWHRWCLAGK
jgi:protein O-GlcNAc transferase